MVTSTAVPSSAVARVVGIETIYQPTRPSGVTFLPQRVAVLGQGNTAETFATTKAQYTSSDAVGAVYGFGSPVHLAALQLLPLNGDGIGTIPMTIYPMEDDGSGVASSGTITATGTTQGTAAAYRVYVNNIPSLALSLLAADTPTTAGDKIAAAINGVANMPVIAVNTAGVVTCTSKWAGASANDIYLEVEGTSYGLTFAVVQPTGGLVNPDISASLAQIGNVWESMLLNCFEIADTTTLDLYSAFGEGRWGALVRKPCIAFTGVKETTVANATTVSDARKTDRTNCQLVEPGGNDLPLVIAARQLARIVKLANDNPPTDYGSQSATGLTPGVDGDQWDYLAKDEAVKKGSSTIDSVDSVVKISDTITMYHPTGNQLPEWRFVVDIVKLQNCIFNFDLEFVSTEWDGAPLIPNNQPTTNEKARKPKDAKAAFASIIDNLALEAILSDPESSKAALEVGISTTNPKRLDSKVPVNVSGNVNIQSIDLLFGFYFGTATTV